MFRGEGSFDRMRIMEPTIRVKRITNPENHERVSLSIVVKSMSQSNENQYVRSLWNLLFLIVLKILTDRLYGVSHTFLWP